VAGRCPPGVCSQTPQFAVNRELQAVIHQYHLPFEHFDALLQGVEMDLDCNRYADHDQLELYCYRVASVVGLLSIEIFHYTDPACRDYAVYLGKALQLTNILRDVRNDAERGRIYLPLVELERYHVQPEEILSFQYSDRFFALADAVAQRARHFYRQARQTLPRLTDARWSLRSSWARFIGDCCANWSADASMCWDPNHRDSEKARNWF